MKPATIATLKQQLKNHSQEELVELCLHLAKFKKENKELLSYLLFDADNEEGYITDIKFEVEKAFAELNLSNLYYAKKGIRKILRTLKKYIRFSKKKETEAALLIYFCENLNPVMDHFSRSTQLQKMFDTQLKMAENAVAILHPDLQYDFNQLITKVKT